MRNAPALCAVLGAMLGIGPALAQQPFLSGVYVGSAQLCEKAKAGSLQSAVLDAGEYALTAQGLKGAGEDCQFLRVDKARGGTEAWLVSALCISPEGNYPELYSITGLGDGRMLVTSVYDGLEAGAESDGAAQPDEPQGDDEADANGVEPGYYGACAGLSQP